jgi:WD40 repeat protein
LSQFLVQSILFKHVHFKQVRFFRFSPIDISKFLLGCLAIGVDTGNIGILDLSGSLSLSFLWQSIPNDVVRVAWHPIREGRIAYSTRLGHIALYDTLTGRSRVVYDWKYHQTGLIVNVLWGPLVPSFTEDQTLAILYSVGDGKFHRWDSPEKSCVPTDLTSLVNESSSSSILTVAFSDDQKYLSVICSDG